MSEIKFKLQRYDTGAVDEKLFQVDRGRFVLHSDYEALEKKYNELMDASGEVCGWYMRATGGKPRSEFEMILNVLSECYTRMFRSRHERT